MAERENMPDYYIDAVLECYTFEEVSECNAAPYLAAGALMEGLGNEPSLTLDDQTDFSDFVNNVHDAIEGVGFEITDEKQDIQGNSYSVDFMPSGAVGGNSEKVVQIRFQGCGRPFRQDEENVLTTRAFGMHLLDGNGQRRLPIRLKYKTYQCAGKRYFNRPDLADGIEELCAELVFNNRKKSLD